MSAGGSLLPSHVYVARLDAERLQLIAAAMTGLAGTHIGDPDALADAAIAYADAVLAKLRGGR